MVGKQSVQGTAINYLGVAIGYVNTILLFPLYFTPEEFGLTRVMLSVSLFFMQFSQLGLPSTIVKFMPYFKEQPKLVYAFLKYIASVVAIGFIVVSITMFFFNDSIVQLYASNNNAYLSQYFYLVYPLIIFLTLFEVADCILKSYFKTVYATFIREVFIRLMLMMNIFLYYLKIFSFTQFMWGFVLIYAFAFLMLLISISKSLPTYNNDFKDAGIKKRLITNMNVYGLFAILTSAGSILVNNIDTIMLGYLVDFKEVAVYAVAFYIVIIIQIPQRNLARTLIPILSESWRKKDYEKIDTLYKKSSLILFFAGAFIFSGIWMNIDALFGMMPKSEIYQQGKYVVLFIGFSRVLDMLSGNNSEIIYLSKYYAFNLVSLLFLIVLAIITNYIFIPVYKANGAAFATLLSIILFSAAKIIFLWKKANIHPFSLKQIWVFAVLIFFTLLPEYFSFQLPNAIIDILLKSVVVTLIFALLGYAIGVHQLVQQEILKLGKR